MLFLLAAFNAVYAETVGLALSGGGARGFAQIGVFQALEENGIEPDLIVGCSMGAVLGGLYSAGYTTGQLHTIATSTDWSIIFFDRPTRRNLFLGQKETTSRHILALRFRGWIPEVPLAFSNGQKLSELLFDLVHRAPYSAQPSFDNLKIPFRAIATDLNSGKPVVFSEGDLAEAMRASVSLPLVFAPYRMDDKIFVDGGVTENIPVEISRELGADVVIAVDLTTSIDPPQSVDGPWELTDRVSAIMHLNRNEESRELADIVIIPELGAHSSTDFSNIDSLINVGYEATIAMMPQIKERLKTNGKPNREIRPNRTGGTISSIRVSGNKRYRATSLVREFPLRKGDRFELDRAQRGIAQIYGSDRFESVNLAVVSSDSGTALTIRVKERPTPQLRLGAGFSTERKGRGFIEYLSDNVGSLNTRLSLFGKYGELDEVARARLVFDRFLTTSLTGDFNAYWNREENFFYNERHRPVGFYFFERMGTELWAGQSLRRWGQVAVGAHYQDIRSGGAAETPEASVFLVGARTIIDTKDSYPFPSKGIIFRAQYDYAARVTNDLQFNRAQLLLDIHKPVTKRVIARVKGDYGWNDFQLPLWGQFSLGSETSVLGLRTAEFYGNSKVTGLFELRYDLLSRVLADAYVSALYTMGAVSPLSDPFPETDNYLHGIGASFALSTFLGPMSVTWGELLKSHFGTGHTQFYVNLGHEF